TIRILRMARDVNGDLFIGASPLVEPCPRPTKKRQNCPTGDAVGGLHPRADAGSEECLAPVVRRASEHNANVMAALAEHRRQLERASRRATNRDPGDENKLQLFVSHGSATSELPKHVTSKAA